MSDNKKSKKDLKNKLSKEAFEVTQHGATETPFSGQYDDFYQEGIYVDVINGKALFSSTDKYDAGCGWPSFTKPIDSNVTQDHRDSSFGMERTEVQRTDTGSHLGHVFTDGPTEKGGLRYCINSAALKFIPKKKMQKNGYSKYLSLFS
ncbi:Peptide methionine sulfoxide reductase MsrB [Pediococcus damnosus]|uniref:Peptide methionine sulfoxide reductase MsrB n=2 Tax=Pediococcus damnosus TaxID=51663 RepID=A0A0R2GSG7_9LACO|nr:peptide-methionine (R)-S-oxide reductase MsrB [Pediococcus damnosus]AMV62115.1 Peptide methionine sulfoxide reductase MsrB [Pediococcus damnosus]AMV68031.1 Peptide methionine sulfoxide reductase MsrB [Pediococcus damnosus]AMV70220.1 Peptide methionine sulfoxide reductase MsrB [Pediococcus damnosus]KJU73738.1 peptide methionine sulfoxide reductase [Pediococcus damnosus LMG 28219]KRN43833.1 methionine sulfoxide reductase B [Pediococcus damnosus]